MDYFSTTFFSEKYCFILVLCSFWENIDLDVSIIILVLSFLWKKYCFKDKNYYFSTIIVWENIWL
jgi:hypothetical protein